MKCNLTLIEQSYSGEYKRDSMIFQVLGILTVGCGSSLKKRVRNGVESLEESIEVLWFLKNRS